MNLAATQPLASPIAYLDAVSRPGDVRLARLAGLAYLALAVLTGFAHAASARLLLPDDAAATAARLAADPMFVRVTVAADIAGGAAWVLLVLILGRLLRDVEREAASALVVFTSIGAAILMLSAALEMAAMRVATGAVDLSALGAAGSSAVALLLLDLHRLGALVAAVFMGVWLFPLGRLAWRSGGMLPAWIGALLAVGGACYLGYVLTAFLAPDVHEAIKSWILLVPTIPEVALVAFLLVVGVRPRRSSVGAIR